VELESPREGERNGESSGKAAKTGVLVEQFVARLQGEDAPHLPTFRDGCRSLAVAKAGVRSHERGEPVHLEGVGPEVGGT
jgi:predicted dehydrogenase